MIRGAVPRNDRSGTTQHQAQNVEHYEEFDVGGDDDDFLPSDSPAEEQEEEEEERSPVGGKMVRYNLTPEGSTLCSVIRMIENAIENNLFNKAGFVSIVTDRLSRKNEKSKFFIAKGLHTDEYVSIKGPNFWTRNTDNILSTIVLYENCLAAKGQKGTDEIWPTDNVQLPEKGDEDFVTWMKRVIKNSPDNIMSVMHRVTLKSGGKKKPAQQQQHEEDDEEEVREEEDDDEDDEDDEDSFLDVESVTPPPLSPKRKSSSSSDTRPEKRQRLDDVDDALKEFREAEERYFQARELILEEKAASSVAKLTESLAETLAKIEASKEENQILKAKLAKFEALKKLLLDS
jgi:hypothetical protein